MVNEEWLQGKPCLEIRGLHFSYGPNAVLQDVSFEVGQGEVVGLVGPNGSGKTTLLKVMSGVLRPGAGSVRIGGQEVTAIKPNERAKLVAVVPQSPAMPLSFTALELVLMGRTPHLKLLQLEGRHDMEVAREAMRLTGTWGLAGRNLGSLSGGERQGVLVARALAQEAPLLLLDEPTANLDLAHEAQVMGLISGLPAKHSGAILVAIHNLTLAAQYCCRLIMLSQGRIVAQGSPEEVLTPQTIAHVYGASVHVSPHPQGGTPVVLLDGSR